MEPPLGNVVNDCVYAYYIIGILIVLFHIILLSSLINVFVTMSPLARSNQLLPAVHAICKSPDAKHQLQAIRRYPLTARHTHASYS